MLPSWWIPYVQSFVSRVQYLYATRLPFGVSSFGRTVSHNAAVGGARHSQHLLWTAADLVPQNGSMEELEREARDSDMFGFVLNEGDHVHVQLFTAGYVPDWVFDQVAIA